MLAKKFEQQQQRPQPVPMVLAKQIQQVGIQLVKSASAQPTPFVK